MYEVKQFLFPSFLSLCMCFSIPFLGLGVIASGVNLNWVMLDGFVVTLPCFPPVVLSIFWSKTSKAGVISGKKRSHCVFYESALSLFFIFAKFSHEFLAVTSHNRMQYCSNFDTEEPSCRIIIRCIRNPISAICHAPTSNQFINEQLLKISGALLGILCGVGALLGTASTYDGGLNNFLENTLQNNAVIAGSASSIGCLVFLIS